VFTFFPGIQGYREKNKKKKKRGAVASYLKLNE
jgi:hypothetical protein